MAYLLSRIDVAEDVVGLVGGNSFGGHFDFDFNVYNGRGCSYFVPPFTSTMKAFFLFQREV